MATAFLKHKFVRKLDCGYAVFGSELDFDADLEGAPAVSRKSEGRVIDRDEGVLEGGVQLKGHVVDQLVDVELDWAFEFDVDCPAMPILRLTLGEVLVVVAVVDSDLEQIFLLLFELLDLLNTGSEGLRLLQFYLSLDLQIYLEVSFIGGSAERASQLTEMEVAEVVETSEAEEMGAG